MRAVTRVVYHDALGCGVALAATPYSVRITLSPLRSPGLIRGETLRRRQLFLSWRIEGTCREPVVAVANVLEVVYVLCIEEHG